MALIRTDPAAHGRSGKKRVLVDGRVYSTAAYDRGMGRYVAHLLDLLWVSGHDVAVLLFRDFCLQPYGAWRDAVKAKTFSSIPGTFCGVADYSVVYIRSASCLVRFDVAAQATRASGISTVQIAEWTDNHGDPIVVLSRDKPKKLKKRKSRFSRMTKPFRKAMRKVIGNT